ncbi:MAG: restriction endonuclease subunit S [Candidatus Cryptobacteroides sp.]|nr:restriction endonuclease subunit S [Candidatus Cryptobacteroides sp.]
MSNIQKNNKPNVPNLRFPEFSGEWEKRKLASIGKFFSGGTPTSSNKDYYDGEIPFIRSGEIHSDHTELSISAIGYENSSAKMVSKGDLLLALYGATSGDIAISRMSGAINQAILCIRTTQDHLFLKSVWEKHVKNILNTYLQGGQGNLSADIVKNLFFYFPRIEEQRKIGRLIELIDQRIAIQNRIIEKYESLIKGIVDITILGKEKNANIGDICSISKQIKVEANLNDIISVRLHGKGVCKSCAENLQIGSTQYYRRRTGQLIYGKQNFHNGAIGIVPESLDNGITSKDIPSFDIDRLKCNSLYLLAQLQSPQYYRQAEALTTGTGSKRLKEETFLKMPIVLPDKEEQDNIASLVSCVMTKLDLARRLLALFSCQKNYLLDQLFV